MVKSLRMPNESAHIEPNTIAMAVLTIVAFLRLIFFSSVKNAIVTSLIEIVDESDAINSKKKNSVDHTTL